MTQPLRLIVHIDGGARGNPGPAAAAFVAKDAEDGTILQEAGIYLGRATNNVAEYRGLLAALEYAAQIRAEGVEVFSDSELMVKQMNGEYRVKNEGLRPLYEQAKRLAGGFRQFRIAHVRREKNPHADRLVNLAIDGKKNVEEAG